MCQAGHDCPLDKPTPKKRERRHACGRYLRYPGKGKRYQLRWWLADGGSVNCGLYPSEWVAERVRAAVVKWLDKSNLNPLGLWRAVVAVVEEFRRDGYPDLPDLLPKYVMTRHGGGYRAKMKTRGRVIILEPFDTPEAAHLAMVERLAVMGAWPQKPAALSKELVSRWVACRRLGITSAEFRKSWDSVFSDPRRAARCESPERMVFTTELDVALQTGGGISDEARGAVALFRIGTGRM